KQIGGSDSVSLDTLNAVAHVLFEVGFARTRYFQLSRESIPGLANHEALYLSWQASVPGESLSQTEVGFSFPWSETSLSRQEQAQGSHLPPMIESDFGESRGGITAKCVTDLGLQGRSWVDIPVYDR